MQKLKINDEVIVLAGKDKGKTGKLIKIRGNAKKVLVEGVNLKKKTLRPTEENPNGGITEVEAFLDISNIAVVSPKTKKATRVRFEEKNGKLTRVAVACGSELK